MGGWGSCVEGCICCNDCGWGRGWVESVVGNTVLVHSLDHLLILVTPHASLCTLMYVLPRQWNLSIVDTIGTQLAVLYREVSLIQR